MGSYMLEELCLEITSECLLDCIHCSTEAGIGRERLDTNVVKRIIDDFESLKGKELEISGGEPLLHPDIWKILEYCKNRSFETTLYSTGVANIPVSKIVDRLDVDRVATSLYEPPITTKDYSMITKEFIRGLVRKGIKVSVHFVPMRQNYRNFGRLVEECEEMGVDEIKILRLRPQGRAKENWLWIHLPEKELKKFIEEAPKISDRIELSTTLELYVGRRGYCRAATSTCLIDSRGNIYPCPGLKRNERLSAGNIHSQSLREIWGKGFQPIREFKRMTGYDYCLAPWIHYRSFEDAIRETYKIFEKRIENLYEFKVSC
jgi:radical SAM protein with 4Fe4S-binding SPASM domain